MSDLDNDEKARKPEGAFDFRQLVEEDSARRAALSPAERKAEDEESVRRIQESLPALPKRKPQSFGQPSFGSHDIHLEHLREAREQSGLLGGVLQHLTAFDERIGKLEQLGAVQKPWYRKTAKVVGAGIVYLGTVVALLLGILELVELFSS